MQKMARAAMHTAFVSKRVSVAGGTPPIIPVIWSVVRWVRCSAAFDDMVASRLDLMVFVRS